MNNASEFIDATPSAALLIESIRDIGYTIETAISDLIDNSISAKANNIYIKLNDDDIENISLEIADDGYGMNRKELLQAMTIGAKDPKIVRDKDDLGRFGLGLKTASFSQCRKLTVESNNDGEINSFTWDLDLVREKNSWIVVDNNKVNLNRGTRVIWEKIDRADFKLNKINTNSILKNIDMHLGLVFHRFLYNHLLNVFDSLTLKLYLIHFERVSVLKALISLTNHKHLLNLLSYLLGVRLYILFFLFQGFFQFQELNLII